MSLPSAPIEGLVVGALVADLPFVTQRARAQICNVIHRQLRSSHSQLKMFLHLGTQHGTVLFEMTAQVAGMGSGRCVILIGREVSSDLAGLVVDQSAAALLESASDGDDVVIDEIISERGPSNVSADLAGASDDLVVDETGGSDGLPMSSISDVTLPTAFWSSDPSSSGTPFCGRFAHCADWPVCSSVHHRPADRRLTTPLEPVVSGNRHNLLQPLLEPSSSALNSNQNNEEQPANRASPPWSAIGSPPAAIFAIDLEMRIVLWSPGGCGP